MSRLFCSRMFYRDLQQHILDIFLSTDYHTHHIQYPSAELRVSPNNVYYSNEHAVSFIRIRFW